MFGGVELKDVRVVYPHAIPHKHVDGTQPAAAQKTPGLTFSFSLLFFFLLFFFFVFPLLVHAFPRSFPSRFSFSFLCETFNGEN